MTPEARVILEAYRAQGQDACAGKGGFFLRGRGFVSLRKARRETGINMAKTRQPAMVQGAWGDYAIVKMLNSPRNQISQKG